MLRALFLLLPAVCFVLCGFSAKLKLMVAMKDGKEMSYGYGKATKKVMIIVEISPTFIFDTHQVLIRKKVALHSPCNKQTVPSKVYNYSNFSRKFHNKIYKFHASTRSFTNAGSLIAFLKVEGVHRRLPKYKHTHMEFTLNCRATA